MVRNIWSRSPIWPWPSSAASSPGWGRVLWRRRLQVPEVIDLAGAYLMPGLINMHVHLCGSGKPVSAGDAGALMKKLDNPVGRAIVRHILKGSAQQQLASGVTTVRGAGDRCLPTSPCATPSTPASIRVRVWW